MKNFTFLSTIIAVIVLIMVGKVVYTDYLANWTKGEDNTNSDYLSFFGEDAQSAKDDTVMSTLAENLTASVLTNRLVPVPNEDTTVEVVSDENIVDTGVDPKPTGVDSSTTPLNDIEARDEALISDFEDTNFIPSNLNAYIREEQVKAAGFTSAYIEEESPSGYFFKTVFIDDLKDIGLRKFIVRDDSLFFVKVYVFSPDISVNIDDLYNILKSRSASNPGSSINITDQFGKSSFYMNDTTRLNTAFLTVKFNSLIYGFAYPKEYHKQITNLIKLIQLER